MNEPIRFHLDENVNPVIAVGLRRYGIDVTTTVEMRLGGKSDETQLDFSRKTGRVIVTQDRDFLIIASSGEAHSGIAYCQKGKRSIGEIIESLVLIYEVLTPEDITGKVEFL